VASLVYLSKKKDAEAKNRGTGFEFEENDVIKKQLQSFVNKYLLKDSITLSSNKPVNTPTSINNT